MLNVRGEGEQVTQWGMVSTLGEESELHILFSTERRLCIRVQIPGPQAITSKTR